MTYKEAVDKLASQYERKNHDYGDSASATYEQFGTVAYLVRISDKINRWCTLLNNKAEVNDESLLDTIGDTFTYCCMCLQSCKYKTSTIREIMEMFASLKYGFNDIYGTFIRLENICGDIYDVKRFLSKLNISVSDLDFFYEAAITSLYEYVRYSNLKGGEENV